ncbi:MAG: NF038122 family metalloprotease [Cyanobacteria bacterium P01_D01_bin.105]
MVQFNFSYDPSISLEQRVGFELAAMIWSSYLTDDVTVNLHIASSASLGQDGQAVGGAIPIFHEQNYGIYQEYVEADATSDIDADAVAQLQDGNTVDFLSNGQVIDGNTDILLTSAQAKALGMDKALTLTDGGTWDRDLVNANALDGYVLVSNAFEWNYDYTRSGEAPEGTLDFMSMALHEIGHQLGFVSGLDGALEINQLYSGETQAEGFTALDLFRYSLESGEILNPDGAVSDLTVGQNSYFSVDGGATNLANFSDGVDYQASHWERLQVAMGIMDPTLAYQERTSLGLLDLQALDVLGWDINYDVINTGLNLDALLQQAEQAVAEDLGLESALLTENRAGEEGSVFYTLGYGELWQLFENSMFSLGYGELWSVFELGYGELWQEYGEDLLNLGYGELWQMIEDNIFNLGYGELWQQFETEMFSLGYGELWQQFETEMLELGYGELWQQLDTFFATVDEKEQAYDKNTKQADWGVGGKDANTFQAGDEDDIIAGNKKQNRIKAGAGDDLIDGEAGHDVIWGEAGRDIIYGQDGKDLLYGGDDDDLLLGENDDDELHGEDGHDILSGGAGDDILSGGEGRDDIKGGSGNDIVEGGNGNDRLVDEAGNDILIGGEGQDHIKGGNGNDLIYGDVYGGSLNLQNLRARLQEEESAADSNTAKESVTEASPLKPIRIEAESMTLSGDYFVRTDWSSDSGDSVGTTGTTTATTAFSGPAGNYMVVVHYFDESMGDGQLAFDRNGELVNSFTLSDDTQRFYTRTLAQELALETGDELTITTAMEGSDNASFDYLEFIPLDNLLVTPLDSTEKSTTPTLDSDSTSADSASNDVFRVEAESMTLLGDYALENNNSSSGSALIGVSNQGEGIALTTFGGESGYYNILVGYYDENDTGIGQISAALNETTLDTWSLDQNLGDTNATSQNFLTRTVANTVLLNNGDIFKLTSLSGLSNSNQAEQARIDYVDFVKVDVTNETATAEPVVLGSPIRIEAESMSLNGYSTESNGLASNNRLIKTSSSGTATTSFSGNTGYYDIVVAYYDETDGLATLSARLGGVELDSWQLDQSLGSHLVSSGNLVRRTIATQVQVNADDELRLEGLREYNEFARIDYVEFIPVSAPVVEQQTTETSNDDFIQAGEGNDTVYGGEGNDVLYGNSGNDVLYGDGVNGTGAFPEVASKLGDGFIYQGSFYTLSDAATWQNAQTQAVSLGGNLVTINDAAENQWLQDTFGVNNDWLWTGLNDQNQEGQFEWVSGQAVSYTNWAPGQPYDDSKGLQDYAILNWNDQGWDDNQGTWEWQGIIEKELSLNIDEGIVHNGSVYLLTDNMMQWQDAQAYAESLGGNLVTINDAAEEQWIQSTFGRNEMFWLGLSDAQTEGTWTWASGEVSNYIVSETNEEVYTNWSPGQPDDYSGSQDYAAMNYVMSGEKLARWDDRNSDDSLRGLIEIKLTPEEGGDDQLEGGSGNDTLKGGIGDDRLEGTDQLAAGYFERDILSGGAGADTFVLGSDSQAYYVDGGDEDYALIQDFNAAEDVVQLYGSASDYTQQQQGSDAWLLYNNDLIAVFEDTLELDFNNTALEFSMADAVDSSDELTKQPQQIDPVFASQNPQLAMIMGY